MDKKLKFPPISISGGDNLLEMKANLRGLLVSLVSSGGRGSIHFVQLLSFCNFYLLPVV